MPRPATAGIALGIALGLALASLVAPVMPATAASAEPASRITLEAPGTGASRPLDLSAAEVDGVVDLSVDKLASEGGVHVAVAARRVANAEYRFSTILDADGAVRLSISRVLDGTQTELGTDETVPGLTYAPGDELRMRVQASGSGTTTLEAKVWDADAPEPAASQLVRSDSTPQLQGGGELGVVAYLSRSATNAPVGVTAEVDVAGAEALPGLDDRETLVDASFDSLPTGPVTSHGFRSELGGGNTDEPPYEDSSIVADPRGPGKVYRLKLDAGSFKNYPAGNNGIVTFVALEKPVDNACISYDIRFDGGFDWSLGGKLPGLQGTLPGVPLGTPTGGGNPGDKGWSSRGMWLGPEAYSWAGPTNMAVSYVYGPEQEDYYGDNEQWGRAYLPGTWHRVTQCHTMNTVGAADGTLEAWMDGVKVLDITDHVYRLRGDVHISHVNWSIFRGGDSTAWAGSRTGYVDIDNVTVTTR